MELTEPKHPNQIMMEQLQAEKDEIDKYLQQDCVCTMPVTVKLALQEASLSRHLQIHSIKRYMYTLEIVSIPSS